MNAEIITDTSRCLDVTKKLEKFDVIAVGTEGVHLGKDGPLTLVQIGTIDDNVYLFDIHTNKDLFTKGKLQDVLTSPGITKVMHSCSVASAALYYQFNIRLQNVFDTQVANLMIEEKKGRELVSLLKLEEICEKYSSVSKVKDQVAEKDMGIREMGGLWDRRPLSDDMVQYAAADIITPVQDVYNAMKKFIDENELLEQFNKRIEEEIHYFVNEKMREQRRKRVNEAILRVLRKIDQRYSPETNWKELDDPDVIMAIERVPFRELGEFSPLISRLKYQNMQQDLDKVEESFASEDGIANILSGQFASSLRTARSCREGVIKDRTNAILDRVIKLTLDHIRRKYDVTTPSSHISRFEKDILTWMRPGPSGEHDPRYNKVVLALYWKLMESELDDTIQTFERDQDEFVMYEGHYKKVKFFANRRSKVPQAIRLKASNFLSELDDMFGPGVIPDNRSAR